MRVELIYTPGCSNYKQALNTLHTVIAEERLPIHVEMVESSGNIKNAPRIRIEGQDINTPFPEPTGEYCPLFPPGSGHSSIPGCEWLRSLIGHKWKELTEKPLLASH